MEFLEKSLFIIYWKCTLPFLLITLSLFYLFRNKKESLESASSGKKLAEEEYIGGKFF